MIWSNRDVTKLGKVFGTIPKVARRNPIEAAKYWAESPVERTVDSIPKGVLKKVGGGNFGKGYFKAYDGIYKGANSVMDAGGFITKHSSEILSSADDLYNIIAGVARLFG